MPYKDPVIRRSKARAYTAAYRAKKKEQKALLPVEPRYCSFCGIDISTKKSNAKFCSREHKRMAYDKKRDYSAEYLKNIEHKRKKAREYYHADIEYSRAKQRKLQKLNSATFAKNTAKRRAAKLKRTPLWLNEQHHKQIENEYALAKWCSDVMGELYHVDHIVPLQGEFVSGLHVPWNLQVIPGRDNIAKNNAFEVV